ncbi:MAG: transcriptional regulator, AraC family, partial [Paenibacillaceae bacterium]|nr:transcriptional regulator, AraC family [Paenibacillaceae bacterium]
MRNYVNRTMFLRLFLYFFVVVFFLNLIMGTLTYFYFKHSIQSREISRSQEALTQSKQMVENTIQEIQRTAMAIGQDIAVRKLLTRSDGVFDYVEAQSVIGLLEEKVYSSVYLHSIYLYNENVGKVIFNNGMIGFDQFWDRSVITQLSEGPPYDSWLIPHSLTDLDGKKINIITYALRIPEGSHSDSYILMNIKLQPFYQATIPLFGNSKNDVAIMDNHGRKIIFNDKSPQTVPWENVFRDLADPATAGWFTRTFGQEHQFITYIKSDFNGWLYIKASPTSEVFKESNLILWVVLAILFICLLAGLILVLLMSDRYYRPIYTLVQGIAGLGIPGATASPAPTSDATATEPATALAPPYSGTIPSPRSWRTDDLGLLRTTFDKLLEEREHVLEEIRRHEERLKDHFLLNLLLGRERDPAEAARLAGYYGLQLPNSGYFVCLLHPTFNNEPVELSFDPERSSLLTYQIIRICRQMLDEFGGGEVVPIDRLRIALIIPAAADSSQADSFAKQAVRRLAEQICQAVG